MQKLVEYVAAGFSGIWIETEEAHEAQDEIRALAAQHNWTLQTWDIAAGTADNQHAGDPEGPVRAAMAMPKTPEPHLTVLTWYHRFLQSPDITQLLANAILHGKRCQRYYIILAPVVDIPLELRKLIVVVQHPLPDQGTLQAIAEEITETKLTKAQAIAAHTATGLTRFEAEGAFALSLATTNDLNAESIWSIKEQIISKTGILTLHKGKESFHDIGGLQGLKTFSQRLIQAGARNIRRRGICLTGVPGTGKSHFAKALGATMARPTIVLDAGALMGSLVGESESRTRLALRCADAMAPCVLMIDEVEKALAGSQSSGHTDGGTTARAFATILAWLNDHESDVFVVCTSNDISKLPPEFARAERFDAIFFVDLPTEEERQHIWKLYCKKYEVKHESVQDNQWTGAEISSCTRLAKLLEVPITEAAQHIIPIAKSAGHKIDEIRQWASGRCLNAATAKVFNHNATIQATTTQRRLVKESQ